MQVQFIGRMSELLATLRVLLARSPAMLAMEVTPRKMEEARLHLRRN